MGDGDALAGAVSTPSSEALDQVCDLRHSRTLPKRSGVVANNNPSSNGFGVNKFGICSKNVIHFPFKRIFI